MLAGHLDRASSGCVNTSWRWHMHAFTYFFFNLDLLSKEAAKHTDAISSNYVYIFYIAPMVLHQNLLNSKNQSEPHRHGEISTWRNSAMFWGSGDRALWNWCEKSSGAEWDV